jgi:predicted nucleotidyltransferase
MTQPASGTLHPTEGVLSDLRGLFEQFPDEVLACYLHGSQARGDASPDSDVDLLVALKAGCDPDAVGRLDELLRDRSASGPVALDATLLEEAEFRELGAALLSDEAVLVFGAELRPCLEYPSPGLVTAVFMHSAFEAIAELYPPGEPIPLPLTPAEGAGEWLGLLGRPEAGPPRAQELLRRVSLVLQALLAARTGRLVHRRGAELAVRYRDVLGGPFCGYVEEVFRRCRVDWRLAVPSLEEERAQLRGLCEQTLAFFTDFVPAYRRFLVQELRHPDGGRRRLARLHILRIPFAAAENAAPGVAVPCARPS